jgi:hypothetical protein
MRPGREVFLSRGRPGLENNAMIVRAVVREVRQYGIGWSQVRTHKSRHSAFAN